MNEKQILEIARVAHEINAAYCRAMGDDSQPSWSDAPFWLKERTINSVTFHLDSPEAEPFVSHDIWMNKKIEEGWIPGKVKDAKLKTHPCLVSFNLLPIQRQVKGHLFAQVVRSMS